MTSTNLARKWRNKEEGKINRGSKRKKERTKKEGARGRRERQPKNLYPTIVNPKSHIKRGKERERKEGDRELSLLKSTREKTSEKEARGEGERDTLEP